MIKTQIFSDKVSQLKGSFFTSMRLLKIVWQTDPGLFCGALASILIPAVIPFLNIYIYKLVIDLVVASVSNTTFDPTRLYPLLGFRLATYFLQEAAFRTQSFMERLLWTKIPIKLNQLIFKKISSLDVHYFEDDKFRDLLVKVQESYSYMPQKLVDNLFFSFQSMLQLSIAFIALAKLNWFFIILISLVAVPEFINQLLRSKVSYGIWDAEAPLRKRFDYLTHLLQNSMSIKEMKIFQLAAGFLKEIKSLQEKFYLTNKKLAQKNYYTSLVFNGLSTLIFVGIEIYVVFEALAKRVTVGDIGFYTGVVSNFQNGLGGLFRNLNEVFNSSLYVKSIFEVLDAPSIVEQPENGIILKSKSPPMIEFKKVCFSYPGSNTKILNDFSLTINPGEKIALVGENGAGKSTIIKLLARFYDSDEGEILIDGRDIKSLDLDSWYKHLGVLFQDFNRYEDRAKQNIKFGDVDGSDNLKEVINASISGGAHEMINKFDKGYEQILGKTFEGGIELSGGQWQKVALARAFFRNAPILVLDEPTAAIDAKAESEIFDRVEKLSKDKTVIIISHRFSTVRNADKIYVLDNGKITESGSHKELMKLSGQYAELFNLQAKGYQ